MTYKSAQTAIASEQFCAIGPSLCSEDTQSLTLNRKSHKFFFWAILLSAIIHLGFSSTLWRDAWFLKTGETRQQTQFSVEIINLNTSATPTIQAPKKPIVDNQNDHVSSAIESNRVFQSRQVETMPKTKRSTKSVTPPHSQPPKKILIENILSSIRESRNTPETSSQVHRESFIVADPDLRSQLEALLNEQNRKKQIGELGQVEKQNKRYAFKAQGNTQIVRLNGKCYQIQQTDAFSLIDIPWTFMGNCEKSKRLEFKTRKLDKEYLQGRDH